MKRSLTITLLLAGLITVAKSQENLDSVKIESQHVKDNIYMLKGAGGNIGVITGVDGIVMIDDQFLPLGDKITNAIRAIDNNPIKFTINTHVHGDHSGGNAFFKQKGSTIVAHSTVRKRMMMERYDKDEKRTIPPRDKDAWPVITFPENLDLHLNGQDIQMMHFGAGHTDGDVIIHFKQANVFHMGDVFVTYGYPYIDLPSGGSISGMITSLDKALALMDNESKVIPGHGELCTKADVKSFRDKLADIRDKVSAALKKGKKSGDLATLGITEPYEAAWGKGFIKGKDFVLMVAESLKSAAK